MDCDGCICRRSRCILDTQGGVIATLAVDHRLEENVEERERITASGGEVGRLSIVGGAEIGPLRCWPGGLCLLRSIGDMDVGEFIVPIPYVKQVKLNNRNWFSAVIYNQQPTFLMPSIGEGEAYVAEKTTAKTWTSRNIQPPVLLSQAKQ